MNYIYCYTNKINGHQYVGQTNDLKRRQNEHWSNSNNPNSEEYYLLFHQKLRQYGKDNFSFTVLEEVSIPEQTNDREMFWIAKLKTYVGDKCGGYNLTRGGDNHDHQRIYSNEIINNIKKDLMNGDKYSTIHEKYGISFGYISGINSGLYFHDDNINYPIQKYYQDENEVNYIYYLLSETELEMTEIAKITNKGYSTIKKINYGILWHNDNFKYPIRKITPKEMRALRIQQYLLEGKNDLDIMNFTGVSRATVKRINSGESYHNDKLSYPLR